jgi:hypothetical protein
MAGLREMRQEGCCRAEQETASLKPLNEDNNEKLRRYYDLTSES